MLPYDETDPQDIENYAKRLIGKTFYDILREYFKDNELELEKLLFFIKGVGLLELKMDNNYDDALKEIEFYKNSKNHQLMLPYIGFNYQEHKVLLVAESHYLENEEDRKKVDNFELNYNKKGDVTCLFVVHSIFGAFDVAKKVTIR